jgi:hypothetical protein
MGTVLPLRPIEGCDRLPVISAPLAEGDPDGPLKLQAAFTTYDRAGYDYGLSYNESIELPLDVVTSKWIRDGIASRGEIQQVRGPPARKNKREQPPCESHATAIQFGFGAC